MLLSKLAKATSSHNSSPTSGKQLSSGSKRATLEIFDSFRQAEDAKAEFQSSTDAEIEAMLDQNLFREDQEEIADSALLLKQF